MENQKQMKNNGLSKSSILLIIFVIILVIVVVMLSSNKNETENKKQESQQISTNTSIIKDKDDNNNNSSSQTSNLGPTPEEFVEKLNDGTKVNTSEKVKQTKKISNFEITDINLTTSNGISTMIATVKNIGSDKTEEKKLTIQILDKEGNVITNFLGVINPIDPGATTTLNASITADVSNAYDFKLIEK